MKPFISCTLLAVILAGGTVTLPAQTNDSTTTTAAAPTDREQATLEKHIKPVLTALNLNDADKEAKVRAIMTAQLTALNTWHAQNDSQIKSLWNAFNKARGKQNEADADAALAKLDTVYASFKPQHAKFISDLSAVLTPAQVESVEDTLTINKVHITYNAYQQIFHGLTPEQNAFILKNLEAAREEAIDAGAMTEKSAFFKKYKIKIEAYLTAQGYDVKQSYKDFVAKQKAEMAAKQPAATGDTDNK
jgi:Spy/CpxP family protein refolding chaperone